MGMRLSARAQRKRGIAVIAVLFFILVASIMLLGVATLAAGHQTRAAADASYAAAIDLADAGVNWEYVQLTANVANADTVARTVNTPFGVANTSFTVRCVNRGTYPANPQAWSGPGTNLDVVATGTMNGTWRTIVVASKGYPGNANYAVFAIKTGTINGTPSITGDVGTNGSLTINGNAQITGKAIANGPGASILENPAGRWASSTNPQAVTWPTVDSLATAAFPGGGLVWLSAHNDNATANPPIAGSSVIMNGNNTLTFSGKPGGSNYYLTTLLLNGNSKVIFNNTNGPINIWFGPSGGAGTFDINGGTASIKMSQDLTKACKVYNATTSPVNLNGNSELDAGIYAYNGANGGQVNFNGTGNIFGAVITNTFNFNGNPAVTYQNGYFNSGTGYYGYDNSWSEISPR